MCHRVCSFSGLHVEALLLWPSARSHSSGRGRCYKLPMGLRWERRVRQWLCRAAKKRGHCCSVRLAFSATIDSVSRGKLLARLEGTHVPTGVVPVPPHHQRQPWWWPVVAEQSAPPQPQENEAIACIPARRLLTLAAAGALGAKKYTQSRCRRQTYTTLPFGSSAAKTSLPCEFWRPHFSRQSYTTLAAGGSIAKT